MVVVTPQDMRLPSILRFERGASGSVVAGLDLWARLNIICNQHLRWQRHWARGDIFGNSTFGNEVLPCLLPCGSCHSHMPPGQAKNAYGFQINHGPLAIPRNTTPSKTLRLQTTAPNSIVVACACSSVHYWLAPVLSCNKWRDHRVIAKLFDPSAT